MKHFAILLSLLFGLTATTYAAPTELPDSAVSAALQLASKAGRLGGLAAQLPATALSSPKKARHMADSLEALADELEHLGDSLSALYGDTILSFDADEADDELANSFREEFKNAAAEALGIDTNEPISRWALWKDNALSMIWAVLIIGTILIGVVLCIAVLTFPIWLTILIVYLIYRSHRRSEERLTQAISPEGPAPTQDQANSVVYNTWRSGVQQTAIGGGLALLFLSLGLKLLCGIAAFIACLGVSKIIISQRKVPVAGEQPQTAEPADSEAAYSQAADNYDKDTQATNA